MPKTDRYQWYTEQFAPTEIHAHAIEETYFTGRTPFQSVAVLRTAVYGKMLVLDGDTQSSQADEKIYHETLVQPAMASVDDRNEILILGGGEGATLREVLRDPAVRCCTMVDIDGQVVELSKKYLPEWSDGAFEDPRARVIIGDALKFLKEDARRYGVVISDLTEPLADSPSFPLFNGEVFRDIKARLAPRGVYVLQASTAGFQNMALHAKMARSLRAHFKYVRSFYTHVRHSTTTGRSSRAATPSTWLRPLRNRSTRMSASCMERISFLMRRHTVDCSPSHCTSAASC